MSFLYPTFLFASFAILIPVVIHFFNLKSYKTVYFSNISFLKKIKERSKSRSQLKHLLVLLARVLAILALVFMFAQPQLSEAADEEVMGAKRITVYLDNSFSMESLGEKGMLLEVAKNKIRGIVQAHQLESSFSLLTNDFELKHSEFVSAKQFLKMVSEVGASPVFRQLSEVLAHAKTKYPNGDRKTIYVLSDFQKVSSDWARIEPDSTIDLRLVPLSAQELGNVLIDSVWFEKPSHIVNADEQLYVRIVNRSEQTFEKLPVTLKINDAVRTVGNIDLKAQDSQTLSLKFTNRDAGLQRGTVSIEDYPITFDNTYFFSYNVVENVSVLVINPDKADKHFSALDRSVDLLAVTQQPVTAVSISKLNEYEVVVLNAVPELSSGLQDVIEKYVYEGGTLLFVPNTEDVALFATSFLKNFAGVTVLGSDTTETTFHPKSISVPFLANAVKKTDENLEMPFVRSKLLLSPSSLGRWENLLWDRHNNPLLLRTALGKGDLYVQTFPLDTENNNYMYHPLFAATMVTLPLASLRSESEAYKIGKDASISLNLNLPMGENLLNVSSTATDFSFVPTWFINPNSQKLNLRQMDRIKEAGHYFLNVGERSVSTLAYNYDRKESDWSIWTQDELQTQENEALFGKFTFFEEGEDALLTQEIKDLKNGNGIWRYFLVFALLCLFAEVLIIRFVE